MSRVTVLTGGSTPERAVALAGARQVVAALRRRGHRVSVVDTCLGPLDSDDEERRLRAEVGPRPPAERELEELRAREDLPALLATPALRDCDAVFLVLHGRQGEGGAVQALLELAGLPYTGSDVLGSALAMDKAMSKRLLRAAGLPTPDWLTWPAGPSAVEALGLPLVVKPSRVGSTVGLSVLRSLAELGEAVERACAFDDQVLLESWVRGRELTVGVLDDCALTPGEIVPASEVFDYESKYTPGLAQEIFPAPIDEETSERLRELALATHQSLGLRHFSRVDFRLDESGEPWILEANTLPGMTATSLLPQSARASGIEFDELCERMVEMALRSGVGRGVGP